MARVAWLIVPYVLHLHAASMPSHGQPPALPRLLKLDISPSSPPASPPPPPPLFWSAPPPPPPCPPNYSCSSTATPPPPPPPPFSSSGDDSPGKSSYSYTAIVALPVLAVIMVFLCSCMMGHNQRAIRGVDGGRGNAGGAGAMQRMGAAAAAGMIRGGKGKGLDDGLVSKLPTLLFTAEKNKRGTPAGEEDAFACAVCISDFEEGETLRLLPACGHVFHRDCIDMWLFSHSTCPLCRLALCSSNGDLILRQEPQRAAEWRRGSHLPVDPGPSSSAPLDRHVFSPLVNISRRSQSLVDLSRADTTRTRGLAALQRSSSQPMRSSKVYPTQSLV